MIGVAFLIGGVAGFLSAIAIALFTDLGWGIALAAYFGVGYALPLLVFVASRIKRPTRGSLPQAEIIRR